MVFEVILFGQFSTFTQSTLKSIVLRESITYQAGFFQHVSFFSTYKLNDVHSIVTEGKKARKKTIKNPDLLIFEFLPQTKRCREEGCAMNMSLQYHKTANVSIETVHTVLR